MDPFAALADPVRRDLLREVVGGPRRVVDLAAGREVSRPAVSRHLRLLVEAGVVEVEERGRERHYRLRPEGLGPVSALLAELARGSDSVGAPAGRIAGALDALETEVRRTGRERRTTGAAGRRDTQEESA
ncbi:ArsR/SmtB family transcription factor [Nocardioides donggukensis]|uniref:Winged helix-turn-helix transcriptional regulator n=1 Tax=Nocardioides donggukensis TaxID=2774019 RepID=A0A927K3S4_9ACTN|nr:metalloregulator ArsR/SmtB family transcription factor [Nocardioides donggukensis]MBD8869874.1 winged helix-turn-helix transcriptional regulator [Nocardioides donggukensis]